jgi:hypothetical protein
MKALLQMRKLEIMALMRAYEEKWIWKEIAAANNKWSDF